MTTATPTLDYKSPAPGGGGISLREGRRIITGDRLMHWAAFGSALTILLLLASLIGVLFYAALPSIRAYGFHFLVGTEWRANELDVPILDKNGKLQYDADGEKITRTLPPEFGALPVIYGTAVSSGIALIVAVPLSLGAALFLTRIAHRRLRTPVSFLIEFLAAIPSLAYGIWGLFVLGPFLAAHVEPGLNSLFRHFIPWMSVGGPVGRDMFCGGLILAIMIIPIISAISRDVLNAVPRAQIEGSIALGATWWQSCKEMLKFSRSALFGAVMLGLARAAGETMAVTMVIGNHSQISPSPLAPAQTMSSLLANEFAESNGIHTSALVEVALVLLVMSLAFNVIARYLVVGKTVRGAAAH